MSNSKFYSNVKVMKFEVYELRLFLDLIIEKTEYLLELKKLGCLTVQICGRCKFWVFDLLKSKL